jgi:HAD superfamily hydrolase (TIGR01549 family)
MQRLAPKGIFFDLVDTLVIHDVPSAWPVFMEALRDCLNPHGLALAPAVFSRQCELCFQGTPPLESGDGFTVFERRIWSFCSDAGLAVTSADAKKTATHIIGVWRQHISLDPDCHHVLETLGRRKTLALVSNYDHPPAIRQVIADMKLEKYFSVIIISGEVGYQKPDPEIFNLALRKTGLSPNEVIHVGDSDDDVNGAISAGILPIRIIRPVVGVSNAPAERQGVRTIGDLKTLLELIR